VIAARTEQVESYYDVDFARWSATTGLAMVVGANDVRYLRPVPVGSTLRIVTQIIRFDRKRLVVEARVYDAITDALCALLWTTLRFITARDGRSAECDDGLFALFGEVLLPVDEPDADARARALRTSTPVAAPA
jgi:acyl-CoA thioesterase FadM